MKVSILKSLGLLFVSTFLFPVVTHATTEGNKAPSMDVMVEAAPVAASPATVPVASPAMVKTTPAVAEKIAVVKTVKEVVKTNKTNESASKKYDIPTDSNFRLALIFGAVGITCIILGAIIGIYAFSLIGAIALIIGLVFFLLWLVNQ